MSNWKLCIVEVTASLSDAIVAIDKSQLRICLVVSTGGEALVGTVTDGDVRRAILKHNSLDVPVSSIMNAAPVIGLDDWPESKQRSYMEMNELNHLPIVNEEGNVVGLRTLDVAELEFKKSEAPVFLMAGGFGTRLRPLTENTPKPLLLVGGRPILETTILQCKKVGISNFIISTHFEANKVRRYFGDGKKLNVKVRYVEEKEPLGTAGALGLIPRDVPALPLLVINGDIISNLQYDKVLAFHEHMRADITICTREFFYQVPFGVVEEKDGRVVSINEKPTITRFVSAGIYVIAPKIWRSIEKGKRLDMPSLISSVIEMNKKVVMFPVHEYWTDVGELSSYEKANDDYALYF